MAEAATERPFWAARKYRAITQIFQCCYLQVERLTWPIPCDKIGTQRDGNPQNEKNEHAIRNRSTRQGWVLGNRLAFARRKPDCGNFLWGVRLSKRNGVLLNEKPVGGLTMTAPVVYSFQWLCESMHIRRWVKIIAYSGKVFEGIINGISVEDGSGRNFLVKFSDGETIFVRAE